MLSTLRAQSSETDVLVLSAVHFASITSAAPRPALVWQRKYATIHTEGEEDDVSDSDCDD